MSRENDLRQKILIVDDSEMNRAILSEMLNDDYDIEEAENGSQAVAILQKSGDEISLVLLDIVMPELDGYGVLEIMNKKRWIEDIPVIMISAENSTSSIDRAYELGVTDFIARPFDALIVRRRVVNTLLLYAKQKKLSEMVSDQIYENEKNSNMMITILSHIVEFRNGESGLHILHVQTITDILLKRLVQITDKYKLSASDMSLISTASALHDIGKISISDEILNKPGRLTDEEFTIMKTHSSVGAEMLNEMPFYTNEPLVKIAYEICRWHHERYDGRGYPDGLTGDEIPISAQIVAIADVYDALTSERVYKKAFSHDKAMDMILNGECGSFNPIILKCLKDSAAAIKNELLKNTVASPDEQELKNLENVLLSHDELSTTKRTMNLLNIERIKNDFFTDVLNEITFEYVSAPPTLTLSKSASDALGLDTFIMNPLNNEQVLNMMDSMDLKNVSRTIHDTTPENPTVEYTCKVKINGELKEKRLICRSVWSIDRTPQYIGVIGIVIDI
ncbi:response regulator [Lachnospiraceae bacterium MD329]|nr:response regulator [Lachnospiraceae bacterium MD329]